MVLLFPLSFVDRCRAQTNLTLSMNGERVFSFDFPVCKMTTVLGTLSMFAVNGVTWMRMCVGCTHPSLSFALAFVLAFAM